MAVQQNGRSVPITLQEKVDGEIEKLIEQGHIEIWMTAQMSFFVLSIVIKVKNNGSVKFALGARKLNKQVHLPKIY